jgi:flagellar motor switch protein FliN/FliY
MTTEEALVRLGQSTAEAVSGILEMFAAGQVTAGEVTIVPPEKDPLEQIAAPAVATSVSYVDGVKGGNVFVMTVEGARRLAAAMMGAEPEPDATGELSELELSAVGEAMNQMMASAAGATTAVLGTEVEIGPPESLTFATADQALGAFPRTPYATRCAFSVCGEPCRLIQLVPNAFIVRMTSALDDLGSESAGSDAGTGGSERAASGPGLDGMLVRVSAELGRATLPSAQLVGMPGGSIVELDRAADEPIDVYVNGRRFATGRLMVIDGTDWAVRIESVLDRPMTAVEAGVEPIPSFDSLHTHPNIESEVS